MTALLAVLLVATSAVGVLLAAAGFSLVARTTRSQAARLLGRLFLGIRTDDLHQYLVDLLSRRADAPGAAPGFTIEEYQRSLRWVGAWAMILGAMVLAFVCYALAVLVTHVP